MIPAILDFIRKVIAFIIALLLYLLPKVYAQADTARVLHTTPDSTVVDSTTAPVPIGAMMESAGTASGLTMSKSPWEAMWRSMVLPGFGQYYNEDYWKVPLFVGATGYLVYSIIDNQSKFSAKSDEVQAAANANRPTTTLKVEREFYRDRRDEAGFYLLGVYIIGIIDAYVGAHLYDFDVGDDLSGNLMVLPASGRIGLQLRW